MKSSQYASEEELYRDKYLKPTEKLMLSATLLTFDQARRFHGGPLIITSGKRTQKRQKELIDDGYKAAEVSTHQFGWALDVAVPPKKSDQYLVDLIVQAAVELDLPRPRIGYLKYRKKRGESAKWVHFDYSFLMADKGMPKEWFMVGLIW